MHISLAGRLGSGKSTVAKILCGQYGFEHIYTGEILRSIAAERGLSALELNQQMEADDTIDRMIDDRTARISRERAEDKLLFDSRMAWHFAEKSFKVYLFVPTAVSAKRIMGDTTRGNVESYTDIDDAIAKIEARMASESLRYKEFYGVDNQDLNNYDLIINTTSISPEQVVDIMMSEYDAYCTSPSTYPTNKRVLMDELN